MIFRANVDALDGSRRWPSGFVVNVLRRVAMACDRVAGQRSGDPDWPAGLHLLAMVRIHERYGDDAVLLRIAQAFDKRMDDTGKWHCLLERAGQVVPAYALLYLHRHRPASKWQNALHETANFLTRVCQRESDGSLRYVPHRSEILVDTLGMICPFLAGYGRDFEAADAVALAQLQLRCFIDFNLDPESGLPFHGYRASGPYRLGLHGWGRGVGWYMLGLVDTLAELTAPPNGILTDALSRAAAALLRWQRQDGHWAWIVPMPDQRLDSSATAFCGYALARAWQTGLLKEDPTASLHAARAAILKVTHANGYVGEASGECRGLGNYSMQFGPQPWAQAIAAAFLSQWPCQDKNRISYRIPANQRES